MSSKDSGVSNSFSPLKISENMIIFWYYQNKKNDNPLSELRFHKLLYFIAGWYYREYKELLFENEFEAWAYGPVMRDIYIQNIKLHPNRIIPELKDFDPLQYATYEIFPKLTEKNINWLFYKIKCI